jgi:hypothetical protein
MGNSSILSPWFVVDVRGEAGKQGLRMERNSRQNETLFHQTFIKNYHKKLSQQVTFSALRRSNCQVASRLRQSPVILIQSGILRNKSNFGHVHKE